MTLKSLWVGSTPEPPHAGRSGTAYGISYEETLRTLGTLLEQEGNTRAVLTLSAEGIEVSAQGWWAPRRWTPELLRAEAVTQRHWRSQRSPGSRLRPGGIAHRLRAVGIALDRAPHCDLYTITVDAGRVHIRGRGGYERTFEAAPLKCRLALAPYLRGQGATSDLPQQAEVSGPL